MIPKRLIERTWFRSLPLILGGVLLLLIAFGIAVAVRWHMAANDAEDPLQNDVNFLAKYSCQTRFVDYAGRIVLNDDDEPVFNFGKHKGRRVVDVLSKEPSYYSWMMDGDFTLDTKQQLTKIKFSMQ